MKRAHLKYDPIRPPDWRFQRVLDVVRHRSKQFNRLQDDDLTRAGYDFVAALDKVKTERQYDDLFLKNMGLMFAYNMYMDADAVDIRFVVAARILARQSDKKIAAKLGTLPETIFWYHAMFFNVRSRLGKRDWIINTVLRPPLDGGASRYDPVIKHVAYLAGPVALENALYGFAVGDRPTEQGQLCGYYDRVQQAGLRRRATLEAFGMEVNRYNAMELMNIHCRMMESTPTEATTAQTALVKAAEGLLSSIPWKVGRRPLDPNNPLDEFESTAGELRADQMMELACNRAARGQPKYDELKTLSIIGHGCGSQQASQGGEVPPTA
jgi:hypothetical protein